MMGVQATSARLFYDFCLDDHVPSDPILRSIDRHLDLDDVRQALKHEVSVALALSEEEIRKAVALFQPDLIICPFLKEKVPVDIYENSLHHSSPRYQRRPWPLLSGLGHNER